MKLKNATLEYVRSCSAVLDEEKIFLNMEDASLLWCATGLVPPTCIIVYLDK